MVYKVIKAIMTKKKNPRSYTPFRLKKTVVNYIFKLSSVEWPPCFERPLRVGPILYQFWA